jgi:hypothetical protein
MSYKISIAEKPSVIFVVFSSYPFVLFSVHLVLKPMVPKLISCWTSFGNVECGQEAGTCWKDWKVSQFVFGIWRFLFQYFCGELCKLNLFKLSGFHGRHSGHRAGLEFCLEGSEKGASCVFRATGSSGCRNVSEKEVCRKWEVCKDCGLSEIRKGMRECRFCPFHSCHSEEGGNTFFTKCRNKLVTLHGVGTL